MKDHGELRKAPAAAVQNIRNDMYLTSEAIRLMPKTGFSAAELTTMTAFKSAMDQGTRYIPTWVKVSVAIALGLGTMAANGSGLQ